MDLIINNIRIPIERDSVDEYLHAASQKLEVPKESISLEKILSKALDQSDLSQFYYTLSIVVQIRGRYNNTQHFTEYNHPAPKKKTPARITKRPIIVGFGPAGMLAALTLIDLGIKPVIFERGKIIDERTSDVQHFIQHKNLNPESNIQFGEGGAGSYSDGKLFSRRNKNTSFVNRVLQTFIKFGAPEEIGYISKPHLGTDVLCKIVRNIRRYILNRGGEIHYSSKMTDILVSGKGASGVIINDRDEYYSSHIYLSLGHSARDTFKMLFNKGVHFEQRPISIGVRIEHSAQTINEMRYGNKYKDFPGLEAATYSINYTNRKIKKGVYTFCMCPGGEIINASSEAGLLVLNGMSYSTRGSEFSNAALVVTCHINDYQSPDPLAGINFQKQIEHLTFKKGGGTWQAPAQNLFHFLGKTDANTLPPNSYKMGVAPAIMQEIFPQFIVEQLTDAFNKWKNEVPLFVTDQAIILAAETRTSSPVRITRNERYESVTIKNVYPIGEGSGYTGGITSSAADGIRAVEASICS